MPRNPPHGIALIISPFASESDEDSLGHEPEQDGEQELSPAALDAAIQHTELELRCLKALRAGDRETAKRCAEVMAQMESGDEGDGDDG